MRFGRSPGTRHSADCRHAPEPSVSRQSSHRVNNLSIRRARFSCVKPQEKWPNETPSRAKPGAPSIYGLHFRSPRNPHKIHCSAVELILLTGAARLERTMSLLELPTWPRPFRQFPSRVHFSDPSPPHPFNAREIPNQNWRSKMNLPKLFSDSPNSFASKATSKPANPHCATSSSVTHRVASPSVPNGISRSLVSMSTRAHRPDPPRPASLAAGNMLNARA